MKKKKHWENGLTIGESGFDAVVEDFIKPEQGAAYKAMFFHDSRIFDDDYFYSTYEKAISNAFEGKQAIKALIRNDASVIFWVRKMYVDSKRYIAARVTQTGEIIEVLRC